MNNFLNSAVNPKYLPLREENKEEYELRCYKQKALDEDISWRELAMIMNDQLREDHWESYYRKRAKKFLELESLYNFHKLNEEPAPVVDKDEDEYSKAILELKKAKVKLSDERTQNNAYIRRLAREETIKEIAHDFAQVMAKEKVLVEKKFRPDFECNNYSGILMLSDWHYGMEISNPFNTYNKEVFNDRIDNLIDQVKAIIQDKKLKELHVVNLSDLIAGRIHQTIRLQSREDVISQVMYVSEVLAEMLSEFSVYTTVVYHDVLDNHSRLEPIKGDALNLESLARIIPWYLKERLVDNEDIIIDDKSVATDIAAFEVKDFKVAAVHGHKDKPYKVIDNMMNMLGEKHDLVLTAHLHHFACEEEHECIRVSNGTLMGVDDFAEDLRLISKPSQTLIIATPDNVCSEIRRLLLD